jgi:chromosome partitioning protein
MGNIISLANQKGGVGKTTTAFNLSSALVRLGKSVLMVDNDPQCNLTRYALDVEHAINVSTDDIYISRRPALNLNELVSLSKNFYLLPAEEGLAGAEYYMLQRTNREFILKTTLAQVAPAFDYVIIDNPPALNLLTVNGLIASDGVVIPVQLEFFSLEGVVLLKKTMESLKIKNPGLQLLGIIPNMFNDRRKLNWEVLEALQSQFREQVFKTKIHDSVKIAESSGHGESILTYAPTSRSTDEYLSLAKEVIENAEKW